MITDGVLASMVLLLQLKFQFLKFKWFANSLLHENLFWMYFSLRFYHHYDWGEHEWAQKLWFKFKTFSYTTVSERAPMCRAPFRSAKDGGGHFLSVSAFYHEKAPWLCLQRLDALKAHNWTNNKMKQNHQWFHSWVLTVHSTLNGTMSPWAWCSSHCIIATSVYAKMLCCNIQWSVTQISYLRHA